MVWVLAMSERKQKRIEKKLVVSIGELGTESMGYTNNLSEDGMYIESAQTFALNEELSLLLIGEEDVFMIKGEVVWKKKFPKKNTEKLPVGLGIRITDVPLLYCEYVHFLKFQSQ